MQDVAAPAATRPLAMTIGAVLLAILAIGGAVPLIVLLSLVPEPPFALTAWILGSVALAGVNLWLCARYLMRTVDRRFLLVYAADSALILLAGWLVWP